MQGVLALWAAETGIIVYRDIKDDNLVNGLPIPGDLLATFVVFAPLAAIAGNPKAKGFATAVAAALVVASLLKLFDPTNPTTAVTKKTPSTTSKETS
jgi:hypothetical protein